MSDPTPNSSALDRARRKAYWRLLPLLFVCYVIAYIDRANVSIAKLTMTRELAGFDNAVIGFGAGIFFWGYFILEIPGAILVEKWSARKWICRIMVSWGIIAALTALVKTPMQFYVARFALGLAEAGFFPGVVVYLTHWFPARDRSRALAYFFIATPVAQLVSPKISNLLLKIGTNETVAGGTINHPLVLGLAGWQWIFIVWGIPAVVLGVLVLLYLKDRPADAKWLTADERDALERQLTADKTAQQVGKRMHLLDALKNPKVFLLAAAYFCCTTANYGMEYFLPSILKTWYSLKTDDVTTLILLPPIIALAGQLFVGWSSDRFRERRMHAIVPIVLGAIALAIAPLTRGHLALTIGCFMIGAGGIKAYQPAFWSLPSTFLAATAGAGSIGIINSLGNLGGSLGPSVVGPVETWTGSFSGGVWFLAASMLISATIIFFLGLGKHEEGK